MHRRKFLAAFGAALASSWRISGSNNQPSSPGHPVRVSVDASNKLAVIPRDFVGLGYEISSVAIPGLFSAHNRTYVQLVRTLSPEGVIRVGGNTSDDAQFSPAGQAVSAPRGTVVNASSLSQLGSFLEATNWQLIWGLNLGSTDAQQATSEAEAVAAAAKNKLLAFEIGNEPDLFGRGTSHRPANYTYGTFLGEYRSFKNAIRKALPRVPFAGPDAASATGWVTQFAADEGNDLKLLTHHYYRECVKPTSSLDKLLHPDPKLAPILATLRSASLASKVPYRICETNSFCGGGKPGVSDTFGAALWVLDFMFSLAGAGCAGVNIETGVNHLGFVSSYSPIRQNESGAYFAAAPYYGMLAFAQASRGQAVNVACDTGGANVAAYAVLREPSSLSLTIINKEPSLAVDVTLSTLKEPARGRVLRLAAPSLESKTGATFGGSAVADDGTWQPGAAETLDARASHTGAVHVPAGSAVVLLWD